MTRVDIVKEIQSYTDRYMKGRKRTKTFVNISRYLLYLIESRKMTIQLVRHRWI